MVRTLLYANAVSQFPPSFPEAQPPDHDKRIFGAELAELRKTWNIC